MLRLPAIAALTVLLTSGAFSPSTSSPSTLSADAWPGSPAASADLPGALGGNISGLTADGSGGVWAVRDAPSELLQLERVNGVWEAADGRERALRAVDGRGSPDAEGVALGPDGRLFVAAERLNDAPSISRNVILEYDASLAGPLVAIRQWDLSDIRIVSDANRGLEALAWLPPAVAAAAVGGPDEKDGPDALEGVFVAGLESDGELRFVRLARTGEVELIEAVDSGLNAVMSLAWIEDRQELWAMCDAACGGRIVVLQNSGDGFVPVAEMAVPTEIDAFDLEGVAVPSGCDDRGQMVVLWADDRASGGHALSEATFDCNRMQAVAPDLVDDATQTSATEVDTDLGSGQMPLTRLVLAGVIVAGVGLFGVTRRQ